jgi:hypothetical protein
VMWSVWTMVVAGAWMVLAPFVAGYNAMSTIATTQAVIAGLAIAGLALWGALREDAPAYIYYILAVLGAWSVAAPFVLGYHEVEWARNSDVLAGAVVAILAMARPLYDTIALRQRKASA